MRSVSIVMLLFSAVAAVPGLFGSETPPTKPNIIVIYGDDFGYADIGIQGSVTDVKTPNIDALARSGVLAKQGYTTAPQCMPSRAGLLTGRSQNRFGLEANGGSLDGFNQQTTFAARLQQAGYATAMFGKWHLGAGEEIVNHGFKHVFEQAGQRPFHANVTMNGKDCPMALQQPTEYHVTACSRAAASLITRYKADPFFLYVALRAPHTPLDAPKSLTDRFPGEMPERRRQALAMISAVDDGVGLIVKTLQQEKLTERTLVFFMTDNGAPLKIQKVDSPINGDAGGWDGSLNTPLNGEKGMLTEGGMHVPFVVSWPSVIPAGQVYQQPLSTLDVAATAVALAGIATKPGELDGVNIIPHLTGKVTTPPHESLYWRWVAQSAIREGKWKLLRGGDREYLYDLEADIEEKHNLAAQFPEVASRLHDKLKTWCAELSPPGFATGPMAATWSDYFDYYLEGKPITGAPGSKGKADKKKADGAKTKNDEEN